MDVTNVFQVGELAVILRRTVVAGVVLGGVALVGLALLGYVLAGVGVCAGIGAGLASNRLFQSSTSRIVAAPRKVRRQIGSRTLVRLGAVTAGVLLALVFVPPLGAGALAGLALFQFLLLANMARLLYRMQKEAG